MAARLMSGPILVTGANGLLGSAVVSRLRALGRPVLPWTRAELDLNTPAAADSALLAAAPAAIVHCAAWTQVDRAEDEPAACRRVNVEASAHLAQLAARLGAAFVYVSSGGVFDGLKVGPYDETDRPAPRTVYHSSKYEGELVVRAAHSTALVVRVGWLFGGDPAQPRNFVAARLREAADREVVAASQAQTGSPTWTNDAAACLVALLDAGATGLCHIANTGACTRLDYVAAILSQAGCATRVVPAAPGAFTRKADVPANESLVSVHLACWGLPPLSPWRSALAAYLSSALPIS